MSSLIKLFKKFPTEESCIEFLENIRWGNKVICPYCNSNKTCKHNEKNRRNRHQCQDCGKSFKVTVGTIFHNTKLDLRKWFWMISMMLNAKKGISACQVARELEMRRPTVWLKMHQIRSAMNTEQKELLAGIFEMDETYVKTTKDDDKNDKGGFGGGRSTKNNTPVVGIKQKSVNIKAFATNDTKYHTLAEIAMNTAEHGSEFHTDQYSSYRNFKLYYKHKTVNHSMEYVTHDKIHCNSVEGFWSLLKRGIKGQFHHISKKYLQSYVTEFEYRYNNRENEFVFSDVLNRMLRV
jgi:transposase-like protein